MKGKTGRMGKRLVKKHREGKNQMEKKGEKRGKCKERSKEDRFGLSRQRLRQHLVEVEGYPPTNLLGAQIHRP